MSISNLSAAAQEILDLAQGQKLSRKKVKAACYTAQLPEEQRDLVLEALGMRTVAQEKAAKVAAEAKHEEAMRVRELQVAAENDQQDAKQAEADAYQGDERARLANVEPHWPTYRRVMELACECNELKDAARHRDIGDVMAYRHAPDALYHVAEIVMLDDRSVAADILKKTDGAMSEKQAKLVAIILAKLATENGMTGSAPVSADTAHKQENATNENEHTVLDIDPSSPQRVNVTFRASKKSGKPYLATLGHEGGKITRSFVKRQKLTNTTVQFVAQDLPVGTVLEARGFAWNGEQGSYVGGVDHLVIVHGGVVFVGKRAAECAARGGSQIIIDDYTAVTRFHDEFLPGHDESPADFTIRSIQ